MMDPHVQRIVAAFAELGEAIDDAREVGMQTDVEIHQDDGTSLRLRRLTGEFRVEVDRTTTLYSGTPEKRPSS